MIGDEQLEILLGQVHDVFGENVTLHREGRDYLLRGQFEEDHGQADADGTTGFEDEETTIELRVAALPGDSGQVFRSDRITARGRTWSVVEPRYDGEGAVVCLVHEEDA